MSTTEALLAAAIFKEHVSWVKAEISLIILAPLSNAVLITLERRVSIETTEPSSAKAFTTGRTRLISSSRDMGTDPGRVDSPPTSMISAPS